MPRGIPGTTSNGIPCACRNSASSPPRSKTNGSPRFSLATSFPSRAFSARRNVMASCSIGCRPALPTSINSAPASRLFEHSRRNLVIVNHDVGALDALQPMHSDEARVARSGSDQVDRRILHE